MPRQKFTIGPGGGQWTLYLDVNADDSSVIDSYKIANPGLNGIEQFYSVLPGQYGQPLIYPERTLSFECPDGLRYVDKEGNPIERPTLKIAGLITQDGYRKSLSNAHRSQDQIVYDDESISINGKKWYIRTLLLKDKNRIPDGYDAYLVKEKPDATRVLELGDLDLF